MGLILATAAYMAPEQAKGKHVDKRADIWAFGCVLFEMLTGRSLFGGDSVAETIGFVATRDPDWAALPASTPASVRRLLARCLTRDPNHRLRDIWIRSPDGKIRKFLGGPGRKRSGRFSPDGTWMAFVSDETGDYQMYVTAYQGPGRRFPSRRQGDCLRSGRPTAASCSSAWAARSWPPPCRVPRRSGSACRSNSSTVPTRSI